MDLHPFTTGDSTMERKERRMKWYVNAIYSKLQVESRTKAVARARELNIV
jgi:DNA-binding NarL/FixJ family response regulator